MEATKRTYKKHKTEKKITVKHYFNETINEIDDDGDKVVPVYVQVTYQGKNTRFRSRIKPLPTRMMKFDVDMNLDSSTFAEEKERDSALIIYLVKAFSKENDYRIDNDYSINDLAGLYHNKLNDLSCFIDMCLTAEINDIIRENDGTFRADYIVKPLISIQYFKPFCPNLKFIQEKYSSNIWFFDAYMNQLRNGELVELGEHRTGIWPDTIIGWLWNPTIQDFKDNYLQKELLKYFRESQNIKDMITDIQKLFDEYEDDYPFQHFPRIYKT